VTGTKDLQHVNIAPRVLSRPVEEHLPEIFSKIGIDFDERVLPGVGSEVLKAVVVGLLACCCVRIGDAIVTAIAVFTLWTVRSVNSYGFGGVLAVVVGRGDKF